MELLEKRAALVPPPRFHLLRYHGVLTPRARNHDRIVPTQPVAESTAADRASSAPHCGHRLGWAALLARVFATDLSACPAGGGRLRIIAALTDPDSIRTYLQGVGRPAGAPPRAPPHTPVRVRRLTSSAMGAGEPYGERRPQWSQRGPGWTRYGPTGNPTLLRALANDLQTILSELPLPLAWVRRLDKRAEKGPQFSYTSCFVKRYPEAIARVEYIPYDQEIIPVGLGTPLLFKRRNFDHEREVRAIMTDFFEDPDIDGNVYFPRTIGDEGRYYNVDLEHLIHEVVIGPLAAPWLCELTQSVTEKYGLNVPVVQSRLNEKPSW